MSKTSQPSNAAIIDKCTQRLNALKNHVSAKEVISIDGVDRKASEVVAIYEACLETRAKVASKKSDLKASLAERADAEAERRGADRALKPWVQNKFGAKSQPALDFGFAPPKAPSRTAESKLLAVARAKATRDARGTRGKREKERIKGTVSSITVGDPVTSTPAPAAVVPSSVASTPVAASSGSPVSPAAPPQASQPASTSNGAPAPATQMLLNGSSQH